MNRLKEIKKDIYVYMAEYDIDESRLINEWFDREEINNWLYLMSSLTDEVSTTITIELIENSDDKWGQVTTYLKCSNDKWYTIILDHNTEDIRVSSIEELALIILHYELEASSLLLTKI